MACEWGIKPTIKKGLIKTSGEWPQYGQIWSITLGIQSGAHKTTKHDETNGRTEFTIWAIWWVILTGIRIAAYMILWIIMGWNWEPVKDANSWVWYAPNKNGYKNSILPNGHLNGNSSTTLVYLLVIKHGNGKSLVITLFPISTSV